MGLSIHYGGTIKNYELILQLVEEIDDICVAMQWKTTMISDERLNGIVFSPENCEPLFFTFNKEGQLASPVLWQYKIEPVTTISVKTQYAGIDAHIAVIKLLRHLSKKYFSRFHLNDEGGYWETNDEKFLERRFKDYELALDFVIEALENTPAGKNETIDSLAERITAYLKKKMGER